MSDVITFYDIPSTIPGNAWSPNTWKTRYCLNIKGLKYRTVWVEYPDIEALCKKIGAKPTSPISPMYTLPVIHDPSTNLVISNSIDIARYLDKTYPSTVPLFPPGSDALQEAFQVAYTNTALKSLRLILLPVVCVALNPPSEVYFRRVREAIFGKKMEEFSPVGPVREQHWKEVKEGFGVVDSWLSKNGEGIEGNYVMGDRISYSDITIAGWLKWTRTICGSESQEWQDIEGWHGGRWSAIAKTFAQYDQIVV